VIWSASRCQDPLSPSRVPREPSAFGTFVGDVCDRVDELMVGRCEPYLVAACIALASSPARSECDTTVDALAAQAQLEIDKNHQITTAHLGRSPTESEVNEIYSRYDQKVSASVARCRRGDVISIPSLYVQRFCNFGKKIVYNGDMATCVKR
jgi:hypothetical protein